MSKASMVVLLLLMLGIGGLWFWQHYGGRASAVAWRTDPVEAFAAAARENKPLLIKFYQDDCPPCVQLDREVFTDQQIGRLVHSSLVPLSVDAAANRRLAAKYGIRWTPTLVVAAPNGEALLEPASPSGSDWKLWLRRLVRAGLSEFQSTPAAFPAAESPQQTEP